MIKLFVVTFVILTGCATTAPAPQQLSLGGQSGIRTGTVTTTTDGPKTSVSVTLH